MTIKVVSVIEIDRPPQERAMRIGWREVLLKFSQIIEFKISEDGFDAHAFAQLKESRLIRQSRRRNVGEQRSDQRSSLSGSVADIDKTSVDFSRQRKIQSADRRPFGNRFDCAAADNRLSHAEDRFVRDSSVISQTEEEQLIEGNGLRVNIENGVGMYEIFGWLRHGNRLLRWRASVGRRSDDLDRAFLRMRRADDRHVPACSPSAACRTNGIEIPTQPPVLGVLGPYKRRA